MLISFQTTTPLAMTDVEHVLAAFRPLPGIHRVAAVAGSSEVVVQFDERTTPLPQLERAVAGAGLPQTVRAIRAGGCCGGCCGG